MVDFTFTEEQEDIRRAVREFAEKEITPELSLECDREEKFPWELWRKFAKLGFHVIDIPEEYGGGGYGIVEKCIVFEEMSRVDMGIGEALLSTSFGADVLVLHGSEEQKEEYLTKLCKGDAIMGMANTEPEAGSDAANIRTRAVLDGDEWVINGSKIFITNGTIANFLLVTARTRELDQSAKHRGISYFIVETDRPGYKATKIRGKMGIRASDTAEVNFNNVRVPKKNLVGEEGKGFYYMMELFDRTRPWTGAQAVGCARGALEITLKYVKERKVFGLPLSKYQFIQFKLAELATKIEAARTLVYRAAAAVDSGKPDPVLSSMAKWYAGEVAVETVNWCLQFHGGYGYIDEYPINRFYRDAKISEIYEGAKEIEKLIIARRGLGLS
ncbi:acyl-CoA dehydrogenase family protein [Archaeoglobus sp.]